MAAKSPLVFAHEPLTAVPPQHDGDDFGRYRHMAEE
jgi:hypothetical protein